MTIQENYMRLHNKILYVNVLENGMLDLIGL